MVSEEYIMVVNGVEIHHKKLAYYIYRHWQLILLFNTGHQGAESTICTDVS